MTDIQLKQIRKQKFDSLEQGLLEHRPPEMGVFCNHSSEDRIVLSHALFLVMTKSLRGRVSKEEFLLLLRQYEEEMLTAYLAEDEYYKELLRYCNIIFETIPVVLNSEYDLSNDKEALRLAAMTIVAAGHAGDMPEDLSDDLLDDMDFLYVTVKK